MSTIQHVTREVQPAALGKCISFYEHLGFEQVPVPPGIAGRALWLQAGGTQIHLMPKADASPQAGHVGIILERYDATVEQIRSAGYEVDARRQHWGSPRSYVRDPGGNLVELMAFGPEACRPGPRE